MKKIEVGGALYVASAVVVLVSILSIAVGISFFLIAYGLKFMHICA